MILHLASLRVVPGLRQPPQPLAAGLLLLLLAATALPAQTEPTARLEEVVVQAESESEARVQEPFLPEVQGTRIFAGT